MRETTKTFSTYIRAGVVVVLFCVLPISCSDDAGRRCAILSDGMCSPECDSVRGRRVDDIRRCVEAGMVTIACIPKHTPVQHVVSCVQRSDLSEKFLTDSDYRLQSFDSGWGACSDSDRSWIVAAPECQ